MEVLKERSAQMRVALAKARQGYESKSSSPQMKGTEKGEATEIVSKKIGLSKTTFERAKKMNFCPRQLTLTKWTKTRISWNKGETLASIDTDVLAN